MADENKKNVIVVMLDSLQFNYLGCYGNKWIKHRTWTGSHVKECYSKTTI